MPPPHWNISALPGTPQLSEQKEELVSEAGTEERMFGACLATFDLDVS